MKIQPIILAAGKGTRMGNPDLPKVLAPLLNRPVIQYQLDTFKATDFLPPALVVGFHQDQVRAAVGEGYIFIEQKELLGTGYAVMVCQEQLAHRADHFLIIYGDQPLWTAETMQRLVEEHAFSDADFSLVTVVSDHPSFQAFGRIIRNAEGEIVAIREYKDCNPEEAAIQEVNPGLYCVSDAWLWSALAQLQQNNAQAEYYLTELLEIAVREKRVIASVKVESWQETLGINTPAQLEDVEQTLMQSRK